MQVTRPPVAAHRPPLAPLLGTMFVGTCLVVGGLFLAYVAFATPLLGSVLPPSQPSTSHLALGVAIWATALFAPATFLLVGTNRLARMLASLRRHESHASRLARSLAAMGADVMVASGVVLPDGRSVADLVVGPFGAAVLRELPPSRLTRVQNGRWELQTQGGWIPLEDPLERASRDADRVRRWLGHDDADFVVKAYAAVVGPDPTVQRTSTCAVLTPGQVPAWIAALPTQRSLTVGRRQQIFDVVRSVARR